MPLDRAQLEKLLCEAVRVGARIHWRQNDVLMMESPSTFPDVNQFAIYLSGRGVGVCGSGIAGRR